MLGSSCGTCWWGVGRRPTDRRQLFMSPGESLCSSNGVPAAWYPEATQCCCEPQLYLPDLGLLDSHRVDMGTRTHTRPLPSPEDKRPGVGCNLEPTMDTKSPSTLRELEAVGAPTFSQRSSSTKSAAFRELQLRAYTLPASLAESCGVRACVGCRVRSFLQEAPHLAIWVTDEGPQSSVSYFQDLQGLQGEEGFHMGGVIS